LTRGQEVTGVRLSTGAPCFWRPSVVIDNGNVSAGQIIMGELQYDGAPGGQVAPRKPFPQPAGTGPYALMRFKTGTPPRVDGRTLDFSKMEEQPGDPEPLFFSFQQHGKRP
jgi:tRNA uridine 5-carboxymethylaminomethyl modification enzyme